MQQRSISALVRRSPLTLAITLLISFCLLLPAWLLISVTGALVTRPVAAQIPDVPVIGYGQTIPGEVTTNFGTEHTFTGCAGETVGFSVTADDFAPRVELYGADDDEPLASAVAPLTQDTVVVDKQTLSESGPYLIVVSGRSRGDRGGYSLTLQGTGPDNPLPDDGGLRIRLLYGDEISDSLTPETVGQWVFRGCAGDEIEAEVASRDFVPVIELYSPIAESAIARGESSSGITGGAARLPRTLPDNSVYTLVVSGANEDDEGDYTLTLNLDGRTVVADATPAARPTATPTPTNSTGPRPRRGVPTPKPDASTTPSATALPTASPTVLPTATPTPGLLMPGVGESAFRVLDVSSEGGPVNHVAYSPDGSLIATAGEDGAVRVWDARSGELVQTLAGHDSRASYVAFSPDDELIASAGGDGLVRLWDQVGRQIAALEMPTQSLSPIHSVAFSPDSDLLVVTTDEDEIFVWDVAERTLRFALEGHAGPVYHATFSPDGALIAAGDSSGAVRIWEVETGQLRDSLPVNMAPGGGDPVLSVAFSNDSSAIVVGGVLGVNDASVQVWDLASRDPIGALEGHNEWGTIAAISPDESYILSAGRGEPGRNRPVNASAAIWSVETGDLLVVLVGYESSVIAAQFHPEGGELLTSDGEFVYIWPVPLIPTLGAAFGEPVGVQIPSPEVVTPAAASPTPRPTATATPGSAATPTPTRTPTSAPTATPTSAPVFQNVALEIFCTVITDRLNLRPGPGTNFNPPIDVLETGELLVVIGRSDDSTWLQVAVLDVNLDVEAIGWVSAEFVFCVGEIEDAPVVEVE